jgi:hypothetical protein
MITLARRASAAFLATLLFLAGANAASGNSADLLKYIPADTPYVLASTESIPAKLADKFEPAVRDAFQSYQDILRYFIAEQSGKMAAVEGGADEAERFNAVAEEFLSLMSLEGIRNAGIERDSSFALYGNGLLPVLRLELSKSELFDAAIERIEKTAEESMSIGEVKGKAYKYIDAEEFKFIVATLDDQAVITVVPSSFDDSQVARALGVTKPRKSLKKSKALLAIGKEYGYSDYLIGFVDNERIAAMLTGNGTKYDKELFAAMAEADAEPVSEVCSGEIMDIAGIAPRIVMGYTELTPQQIESSMIIELRTDIAEGLATIPTAVPGLGIDPGGFMSFGFSFDLMALRAFFEARLDAIDADPYECEALAMLGHGVNKGREALNQPLPPVVYNFRGFVANIADVECEDAACNSPPKSVDASVLLAVDNAKDLLMMAALMDPQIAALNLVPDGKPVRADVAKFGDMAEDAFAAMSDNAISLSVGAGAESNAAAMLVADAPERSPIMSMSMDSARYYSMLSDAMALEPPVDEEGASIPDPMPEEIRDAMRELMMLSGDMYKRMSFDVFLTDRGVEIGALLKLSD